MMQLVSVGHLYANYANSQNETDFLTSANSALSDSQNGELALSLTEPHKDDDSVNPSSQAGDCNSTSASGDPRCETSEENNQNDDVLTSRTGKLCGLKPSRT